jgi:methionine-rich copper-binding protein CopC
MTKRITRILLSAALVAALFSAVGVTTASAHVRVVSTNPATGGSASRSIRTVRVTFNAAIRSGTLRVFRRSTGAQVSGTGARNPRNLRQLVTSLRSGLAAGRYIARWTLVASDGHRQSGSFGFRLT